MKKNILVLISALMLFASENSRPQSLGVILESNSFNTKYFSTWAPARGKIKNLFIAFNYPYSQHLSFELRGGYGWNKDTFKSSLLYPSVYKYSDIVSTEGIPVELMVKYSPFGMDETPVEPYIAAGSGYYDYRSAYYREDDGGGFRWEFRTRGLCYFVILGASHHFTQNISGYLELKNYIVNNLRTKWTIHDQGWSADYDSGYSSPDEGLEFSISLGLSLNL